MEVSSEKRAFLVAAVQALLLASAVPSPAGQPRHRFTTTQIQRGEITTVEYATGAMEPLATVAVTAAVAGTVVRMEVMPLTRVRSSDVLAQLDSAPFEARVNEAREALAQADSRCKTLEVSQISLLEAVERRRTSLGRLQAAVDESRQSAERAANLFQQGVLPQEQHDLAQADLQTAEARLREAEEQVREAQAQLDRERKRLEESQSSAVAARRVLELAEANLRATTLRAPMDGTVVTCNIRAGQAVTGPGGPALFRLAADLKRLRVSASLDGPAAASIKAGNDVIVKADAFPSAKFQGRIVEVRQGAEASAPASFSLALIEVENPEEKLAPGEMAFVTIPISHVTGVLKIPNAALRFVPALSSRLMNSLYEKNRIPAAASLAEAGDRRVVWRLARRRTPEPVAVRIGITDHNFTELREGKLKEGDTLITGESRRRPAAPGTGTPRVGEPPGGRQP